MAIRASDGSVIIDVEADLSKFKTGLNRFAAVAGVSFAAITAGAAAAAASVISMGVSFESAFAGVEKTVNASTEELAQFRKEIIDLSTTIPITANEIAGIAEAAGQLGITNENLMDFTETMANLGVATNMTSNDAATQLARLANITGMSQDKFENLGSAIVALGNNFATTESEITDMALNIAAAGSQVGMTEADITGLSAALSSVGIEAAAGGTAVSTMLSNMQLAVETGNEDLKNFADVAGQSTSDFKKSFKEDATGALVDFITGLGTAEDRGVSAIKVLDDMGISEVRLRRTLLSLAGSSDMLNKAIATSNDAWQQNTALTNEANKRYETTESKMQLLKNSITEVGITVFDKFEEPLKSALNSGIDSVQELTDSFSNGKLGASVDRIAESFSKLVSGGIKLVSNGLPVIVDGFAWMLDNGTEIAGTIIAVTAAMKAQSVVKFADGVGIAVRGLNNLAKSSSAVFGMGSVSIGDVTYKLTSMQTAVSVLTGKVKVATIASAAWKAVSPATWAVLGIAGITALGVAVLNYARKNNALYQLEQKHKKLIEETTLAIDEQTESADKAYVSALESIDTAERYSDKLENLFDSTGKLTGSQDEAQLAIDNLNQTIGDGTLAIDENTGSLTYQGNAVENLTKLTNELIESKKMSNWLDANADKYSTSIENQTEYTKELIELQKQRNSLVDEYGGAVSEVAQIYASKDSTKTQQENLAKVREEYGLTEKEMMDVQNKAVSLQEVIANMAETDAISRLSGEFVKLYESVQDGEITTQQFNSVVAGIDPAIINGSVTGIDELASSIDSLVESKNNAQELSDSGYFVSPDLIQSQEDSIKSMIDQLNQSGYDIDYDAFMKSGMTMAQYLKDGIESGMSGLQEDEEYFNAEDFFGGQDTLTESAESIGSTMAQSIKDGQIDGQTESQQEIVDAYVLQGDAAGDGMGNAFECASDTHMDSTKNYGVSQINALMSEAQASASAGITIPVYYKVYGDPLAGVGGGSGGAVYQKTDGASYDSMISTAKSAIRQSAQRLVINVTGPSVRDSSRSGNQVTMIANFNQPIEKASQATKQLEQFSKELAKG